MIYAVLDTNVLVSALLSKSADSTISKLIDHVIDGHLIPMYSQEILDEYTEVLSRSTLPNGLKAQKAFSPTAKRSDALGYENSAIPFALKRAKAQSIATIAFAFSRRM